MDDAASTIDHIPLGSEAASGIVPLASVKPGGYAAPAHFLDLPQADELASLSQLAAQVLQDPLAMQRLSDRVLELLQRDLTLQRERSRGYGRRW